MIRKSPFSKLTSEEAPVYFKVRRRLLQHLPWVFSRSVEHTHKTTKGTVHGYPLELTFVNSTQLNTCHRQAKITVRRKGASTEDYLLQNHFHKNYTSLSQEGGHRVHRSKELKRILLRVVVVI